ncbi:hypothetical protein [Leucobacter chromiiresistens]|uniref:hypothetical protein n=1 Tax=Leucobacter chromiiresistens TaxID=1079994 RepID=UPI000262A4EF|nr:hypothetical protein [Leucobacter chromiiresistens]
MLCPWRTDRFQPLLVQAFLDAFAQIPRLQDIDLGLPANPPVLTPIAVAPSRFEPDFAQRFSEPTRSAGICAKVDHEVSIGAGAVGYSPTERCLHEHCLAAC